AARPRGAAAARAAGADPVPQPARLRARDAARGAVPRGRRGDRGARGVGRDPRLSRADEQRGLAVRGGERRLRVASGRGARAAREGELRGRAAPVPASRPPVTSPRRRAGRPREEEIMAKKPQDVRVGARTNRTGIAAAPHADEMKETALHFQPKGTPDAFHQHRIDARRGEPPVGTMPPPASLKGAAKEALRTLTGVKGTVLLDKLDERLA